MLTKNTGRRKSIFNVPKPALPFCGVARGDWSAVPLGAAESEQFLNCRPKPATRLSEGAGRKKMKGWPPFIASRKRPSLALTSAAIGR